MLLKLFIIMATNLIKEDKFDLSVSSENVCEREREILRIDAKMLHVILCQC